MIESKEAIEARINQTNKIYEPTRLRFELGEILPLPEGILELVTRENRNALAEKVPAPAGVIKSLLFGQRMTWTGSTSGLQVFIGVMRAGKNPMQPGASSSCRLPTPILTLSPMNLAIGSDWFMRKT